MSTGGPTNAGPPRTVLISQRDLWDAPWFSYVVEFESVLAELLEARTLRITTRDGHIANALRDRYRLRSVLASLPLARAFSLEQPAEHYDLGIIVVNDLQQLGILASLPGWRKMADRFIAFVVELWPSWVAAARPAVDDVVSKMTAVFSTIERTTVDLRELSGTDVHFLPPGVDTLFVDPPADSGRRYVSVSNRGRRDPAQHEMLRRWATASGRVYEFDTGSLTSVEGHFVHREHYYEQCARSKVYVTNFARFDQPQLRDGAEELGLRYFEGIAAGCVLAGQHPGDDRVARLVGDVHVVDMPIGATEMPAPLRDLLDDDDRIAAAGRANRLLALQRHDVLHRWDVVRSRLDLPTTAVAEQRRLRLEDAARKLSA